MKCDFRACFVKISIFFEKYLTVLISISEYLFKRKKFSLNKFVKFREISFQKTVYLQFLLFRQQFYDNLSSYLTDLSKKIFFLLVLIY